MFLGKGEMKGSIRDCFKMLKFKKFKVGNFFVCKDQIYCIALYSPLPPLCILGSTDVRHLMLWENQVFVLFLYIGKAKYDIMSDIDLFFHDSSGNCDNWLLFT